MVLSLGSCLGGSAQVSSRSVFGSKMVRRRFESSGAARLAGEVYVSW